jgi:site-specific DNA recombinase
VVRVSVSGDRGESLRSPDEQRQRIAEWCEREGFELVAVHEEIDISGGKPLAQRPGLQQAVEAVERGGADVVAVAYFDRLVRSLVVQAEVVQRIEGAGGRVMALDVGRVTEATAGEWLKGSVLGLVSEYYRRSIGERVASAEARMVEQGISPHKPPPGFARGPDRRLIPSEDAPVVREAFAMRAAGQTIKSIRGFMAERGVVRSYHGVQEMLRNRTYLGEVRRGERVNTTAHEPLIDPDTWAAVQRARVSQGRQAESPLLLARLGVLRCGSCGGVMVSGAQRQRGKRYPMYRCAGDGRECAHPVYITASIADEAVEKATVAALSNVEGRASAQHEVRSAVAALEAAQVELDAAIRAFSDLMDEPAAVERLRELRDARDTMQERVAQLGDRPFDLTFRPGDEWESLPLDRKRLYIRAVIERAVVRPGRGQGRVSVELRG